MSKYIEEIELSQIDFGELIKELEDWKQDYEPYEFVDPVAMIETFEDMLINN